MGLDAPVELDPSGPIVVWAPQPGPQTAFLECPVFEVFFGGARGGGKTEAQIGDWIQHSNEYGEQASGIFVRRRLTQLTDVIKRTRQIFSKLGASYNIQTKTWTMAGGGTLRFVYLERDSDAEEYQGHSYTRVYVEELTNFPSAGPINKLRATLRSGTGVPCGMRATGNPGGPGHKWVKARYIDPAPQGYKVITESEEFEYDGGTVHVSIDRVFIPSRLGDNPLLMRNDPAYVLRLKQTGSEALVRAWLTGDWNIVDGAFFDEFDYNVHVLSDKWIDLIPTGAIRFRAFDWGSAKPFSVGWYAVSDGSWGLPKDALLKYREWYGAKGPNEGLKMSAKDVAEGIRERERGEKITYGAADPSIFIQDGGPSIGETMSKERVYWKRGDNRRIPGWTELRKRLVGDELPDSIRPGFVVKRPMLYFVESCFATIDCIPTLQHDDDHPEDVDTESEDHAGDETRYAVMSRPFLPKGSSVPPPDKYGSGKPFGTLTIREMINRQIRRMKQDEE